MNDYTHKRLIIQNIKTGDKKTVVVKIGSSYTTPAGYKIIAEYGRTNLTNEGKH